MKLSVTTLGWPSCTLDRILADMKSVGGFAGIDFRGLGDELDITRLPEFNERLDETLGRIRAAGLVVSGLCTSCRLIAKDDADRAKHLDEIVRYCKLADRIGTVEAVRVFGGAPRKGQGEFDWKAEAVVTLRNMVKATEGCRTPIAIETHDAWCRAADVGELMRRVNHPRARVLWDLLITQLMGKETPDESAKHIGPLVVYTHVKDGYIKDDAFGISMVGQGEVDLPAAMAALKSIGYDGWLTFEWEKRWHPEIADAVEALPAYRKVLEPLM
ncbi:MAG: hypothetical protein BIFFINMI_01168 [Phycisphaerae bacterium]|nr:hypothetical protein [Phycisphaerae bacterium]